MNERDVGAAAVEAVAAMAGVAPGAVATATRGEAPLCQPLITLATATRRACVARATERYINDAIRRSCVTTARYNKYKQPPEHQVRLNRLDGRSHE